MYGKRKKSAEEWTALEGGAQYVFLFYQRTWYKGACKPFA